MNQGDYVTRKSYGGDIVFRIESIENNMALLRGIEFRLLADAPLDDLTKVDDPYLSKTRSGTDARFRQAVADLKKYRQSVILREIEWMNTGQAAYGPAGEAAEAAVSYFEMPGKVLHLDGDPEYLRKSMELYRALRVPAEGHHVREAEMAAALQRLLPKARPDIVVLTGHDGMYKNTLSSAPTANAYLSLEHYKNSGHFVEAVRTARQYERDLDRLVIIAGACQSNFEALLRAGANFASSPARILIHALDPGQIAARASYASMRELMPVSGMIAQTASGLRGMGGIETRGCYRIGMPNFRRIGKSEASR